MRGHKYGLAAIVAVVSMFAVVPSAHATDFYLTPGYVTSTAPSGCSVGGVCIYEHHNWGGGRAQRTGSDSDWRSANDVFNNGVNMNDRASSIFNNSSTYTYRFFRNTGYGSHVLCVAPKKGIKDLKAAEWIEQQPWGPQLSNMTDRISSHSSSSEHIDNLHCNWRIK